MSMDSNDKTKPHTLFKSFSYAISGILDCIKLERNLRIHLCAAVLVIGFAIFFSITKVEWLIILLLIGGMAALELVNSAVERVVDLVTKDYHPLAKQAKDMAAGAVFVYAILSVVIGAIIFLPYLFQLF